MVGRCPESFSKSVTLLAASVATGVHRQFPGQDLHLQGTQRLCTALRTMRARRLLGAGLANRVAQEAQAQGCELDHVRLPVGVPRLEDRGPAHRPGNPDCRATGGQP